MPKEWEKVQADFKKLKSTADRQTDKVAPSYLKQITQSMAAYDKGEEALSGAVKPAREGGVTGTTLDNFQKFKEFPAALKALGGDCRDGLNTTRKVIEASPERAKIEKLPLLVVKSGRAAERAVLAAKAVVKKGQGLRNSP